MNIGDKKTVNAMAPANMYHKLRDHPVTIIGICEDEKGEKVYTFRHSLYGFGAMYAHGFR